WSGSREDPAGPRSHQVSCSRLEIKLAHTIATFRAPSEICAKNFGALGKIFQQLEPCCRHRPRKFPIDVFHLTPHGFGRAMRISFQLSDNEECLSRKRAGENASR